MKRKAIKESSLFYVCMREREREQKSKYQTNEQQNETRRYLICIKLQVIGIYCDDYDYYYHNRL